MPYIWVLPYVMPIKIRLASSSVTRAELLKNANITKIVDKLENRQLAARKPVPGDRRANLVSITNKGKQLFEEVIPIVLEVYEDVVSCITKEDEAITLNTLKKIITHLVKN